MSKKSTGQYRPPTELEDNPEFFNEPPVIEHSQVEIKDMMRVHRASLVDKLLNLWLEAYTQQNKDKDMQIAIAVTIQDIQNIDLILKLTNVPEDKQKSAGRDNY